MNFDLNDEQSALRDAVRQFCDGEYPAHQRGEAESAEQALRRRALMAEIGLSGLPFDQEFGGSGLGPVESMLVAEELGRALVAGPWLTSTVMAGGLLAEIGTTEQCQRWLPPLARGDSVLALACQEAGARYALAEVRTTARRDAGGWLIDGQKVLVAGAGDADLLLVVARTSGACDDPTGLTLFAIDAQAPGVRCDAYSTIDGRRAATLTLQAVRVGPDRVIGPVDGALRPVQHAIDRAEAALCAEAAGAIDALLQVTAEHLRTRRQFGAPLAKFQALQHRIADMAISVEQVKSMACVAAVAVQTEDDRERQRLLSAAKALTAQVGRRCAFDAIQLHGAMGMTDECVASRHAKRLIGVGQWFGDAPFHLRRFVSLSQQASIHPGDNR